MDVMLVTIVFPWPSEAYAGVEVRALQAAGARVRVRTLRAHHPRARELLRDWQLSGVDLEIWSGQFALRGLGFMVRHPWMAASTLGWLVRRGWSCPGLLARCLLLIPGLFAIFDECLERPPSVLNLFWGHYPSVLAYMARRWLPEAHVAMSLNAYDLVYAFPPSLAAAQRVDSLWTIARANLGAMHAHGLDPGRVHVSYHGIDLGQVPADCSAKDVNRFVVIARLEENKGVDDAIRAFATVARDFPGVRLAIIGEGPDRGRLAGLASEEGVANRVQFTGGIGHTAVYEYLAASSVLLLLSRSPAERLPNAVKEAMACRCLCVVTDTPGIDDLVGHLAEPMVVAQGDWRAGADWLDAILREPGRFAADRDAGRSFALENFDAARIARRRLAVWSQSR